MTCAERELIEAVVKWHRYTDNRQAARYSELNENSLLLYVAVMAHIVRKERRAPRAKGGAK